MIPNEGVLAKDMVATATATVNGDTVYPYEAAKLAVLPGGRFELHGRTAR
ncbi:MAG: hypothetical protein ACLSHO_05665 [Dysosmobacter sp.]